MKDDDLKKLIEQPTVPHLDEDTRARKLVQGIQKFQFVLKVVKCHLFAEFQNEALTMRVFLGLVRF